MIFRIQIFFRVGLAIASIILPLGFVGMIFSGVRGGFWGACIGALIAFLILCTSEAWIVRAMKSHRQETSKKSKFSKGLERSLQLTVRDLEGGTVPRLVVFSDPVPGIYAVKSLLGPGTVLMSQGLMSLLTEEEFRLVFKLCMIQIRRPGAVLQGFCSVLVTLILASAPKSWVRLIFSGKALSRMEERLLSPFSILGLVIHFPFIRFFMKIGQIPGAKENRLKSTHAFKRAEKKMVQAVQVLGSGRSQWALSLFSPL